MDDLSNIRREVRLFGIAYALLAGTFIYFATGVTPKTPWPSYVYVLIWFAGVVSGLTAAGALLRKSWTPVFAVSMHAAIVLAGVVATIVQATHEQHRENLSVFLLSRVGILSIYGSFVLFWLRDDVKRSLRAKGSSPNSG